MCAASHPNIRSVSEGLNGSKGSKRPAKGFPVGQLQARICAPATLGSWGDPRNLCGGRGAGHKNPASRVSGLCGPMDTRGLLKGHVGSRRKPLPIVIINIIIVSMTCAYRCGSCHSKYVEPWRANRPDLRIAGQTCAGPAGYQDTIRTKKEPGRCKGPAMRWKHLILVEV